MVPTGKYTRKLCTSSLRVGLCDSGARNFSMIRTSQLEMLLLEKVQKPHRDGQKLTSSLTISGSCTFPTRILVLFSRVPKGTENHYTYINTLRPDVANSCRKTEAPHRSTYFALATGEVGKVLAFGGF